MDGGAPPRTPNIKKMYSMSQVAVFVKVRSSPLRYAVRLTTNLGVRSSNLFGRATDFNDLDFAIVLRSPLKVTAKVTRYLSWGAKDRSDTLFALYFDWPTATSRRGRSASWRPCRG